MISYRDLYDSGALLRLRDTFREKLCRCRLCPRNCQSNRLNGETGFCRAGRFARVSSAFLHFGEETELVGRTGSGAIFFAYCNLGCFYCQNYNLSHNGEGYDLEAEELAAAMLDLQRQGAENINFVSPTHYTPQIIEALVIAAEGGLKLPLVYNCGGYESAAVLKELEGIFDIYMPDIKYADNAAAKSFSQAGDYWQVVQAAVKEMHRQVGDLVVEAGVARRGLLVRHLVLPNRLAGSSAVLDFIKADISPATYVNIMNQYRPCYHAYKHKDLSRRITVQEYQEVVDYAHEIGLSRGF